MLKTVFDYLFKVYQFNKAVVYKILCALMRSELVQEQLIWNELRSRLSMFTAIQWIIKPSACKFIKK